MTFKNKYEAKIEYKIMLLRILRNEKGEILLIEKEQSVSNKSCKTMGPYVLDNIINLYELLMSAI